MKSLFYGSEKEKAKATISLQEMDEIQQHFMSLDDVQRYSLMEDVFADMPDKLQHVFANQRNNIVERYGRRSFIRKAGIWALGLTFLWPVVARWQSDDTWTNQRDSTAREEFECVSDEVSEGVKEIKEDINEIGNIDFDNDAEMQEVIRKLKDVDNKILGTVDRMEDVSKKIYSEEWEEGSANETAKEKEKEKEEHHYSNSQLAADLLAIGGFVKFIISSFFANEAAKGLRNSLPILGTWTGWSYVNDRVSHWETLKHQKEELIASTVWVLEIIAALQIFDFVDLNNKNSSFNRLRELYDNQPYELNLTNNVRMKSLLNRLGINISQTKEQGELNVKAKKKLWVPKKTLKTLLPSLLSSKKDSYLEEEPKNKENKMLKEIERMKSHGQSVLRDHLLSDDQKWLWSMLDIEIENVQENTVNISGNILHISMPVFYQVIAVCYAEETWEKALPKIVETLAQLGNNVQIEAMTRLVSKRETSYSLVQGWLQGEDREQVLSSFWVIETDGEDLEILKKTFLSLSPEKFAEYSSLLLQEWGKEKFRDVVLLSVSNEKTKKKVAKVINSMTKEDLTSFQNPKIEKIIAHNAINTLKQKIEDNFIFILLTQVCPPLFGVGQAVKVKGEINQISNTFHHLMQWANNVTNGVDKKISPETAQWKAEDMQSTMTEVLFNAIAVFTDIGPIICAYQQWWLTGVLSLIQGMFPVAIANSIRYYSKTQSMLNDVRKSYGLPVKELSQSTLAREIGKKAKNTIKNIGSQLGDIWATLHANGQHNQAVQNMWSNYRSYKWNEWRVIGVYGKDEEVDAKDSLSLETSYDDVLDYTSQIIEDLNTYREKSLHTASWWIWPVKLPGIGVLTFPRFEYKKFFAIQDNENKEERSKAREMYAKMYEKISWEWAWWEKQSLYDMVLTLLSIQWSMFFKSLTPGKKSTIQTMINTILNHESYDIKKLYEFLEVKDHGQHLKHDLSYSRQKVKGMWKEWEKKHNEEKHNHKEWGWEHHHDDAAHSHQSQPWAMKSFIGQYVADDELIENKEELKPSVEERNEALGTSRKNICKKINSGEEISQINVEWYSLILESNSFYLGNPRIQAKTLMKSILFIEYLAENEPRLYQKYLPNFQSNMSYFWKSSHMKDYHEYISRLWPYVDDENKQVLVGLHNKHLDDETLYIDVKREWTKKSEEAKEWLKKLDPWVRKTMIAFLCSKVGQSAEEIRAMWADGIEYIFTLWETILGRNSREVIVMILLIQAPYIVAMINVGKKILSLLSKMLPAWAMKYAAGSVAFVLSMFADNYVGEFVWIQLMQEIHPDWDMDKIIRFVAPLAVVGWSKVITGNAPNAIIKTVKKMYFSSLEDAGYEKWFDGNHPIWQKIWVAIEMLCTVLATGKLASEPISWWGLAASMWIMFQDKILNAVKAKPSPSWGVNLTNEDGDEIDEDLDEEEISKLKNEILDLLQEEILQRDWVEERFYDSPFLIRERKIIKKLSELLKKKNNGFSDNEKVILREIANRTVSLRDYKSKDRRKISEADKDIIKIVVKYSGEEMSKSAKELFKDRLRAIETWSLRQYSGKSETSIFEVIANSYRDNPYKSGK